MASMENHSNYRIPFNIPTEGENFPGQPQLHDEFKTHVLIEQLYYTRAYILGSEDQRTLEAKTQLEKSEKMLRKSKKYPFRLNSSKHFSQDRLDEVVDQSFQFTDPLLSKNYEVISRKASGTVTNYVNQLASTWYDFCSPDKQTRITAYEALNTPNEPLINSLVDVFKLQSDYMCKKAGSVRRYFQKKDGIDWSALFDNQSVDSAMQQFGYQYSESRKNNLNEANYHPHDMYAPNIEHDNGIQSSKESETTRESLTQLLNFLSGIGLEDVAKKLISAQSYQTGGYLIHLGRNWEPHPLVFMSESSGRKIGSVEFDIMHAHEAGHAAAHYMGSNISKPLYSINNTIAEFPSTLLELIYKEPETLRFLGYDETTVQKFVGSFPSLSNSFKNSEFEYRLLIHAENGTLNEKSLGEEFANSARKYYGIDHEPGDTNHVWQFLMSRQILHGWFNMRSYLVGKTLAQVAVQKIREDTHGEWVGSERFKNHFSSLFRQLFTNGPFVNLGDIENALGIKTEEQILSILQSEVTG